MVLAATCRVFHARASKVTVGTYQTPSGPCWKSTHVSIVGERLISHVMTPPVTVLIPVFECLSRSDDHSRPYVEHMIQDLQSQTLKDFEVRILDNQSSDGTAEFIQRQVAKDHRFVVLGDSEQRTPEMAIRSLIDGSDSDYVCLLNDDDRISPGYLESLYQEHERRRADLVYCGGSKIDERGKRLGELLTRRLAVEVPSFGDSIKRLGRYLAVRNSIPAIFGLWRTASLQNFFPDSDFFEDNINLDHIVFARMCWGEGTVHITSRAHFDYRMRVRRTSKGQEDSSTPQPVFDRIAFLFRSETHFSGALSAYARRDLEDSGLVESAIRQRSSDHFVRTSLREAMRCNLARDDWQSVRKLLTPLARLIAEPTPTTLEVALSASQTCDDPIREAVTSLEATIRGAN